MSADVAQLRRRLDMLERAAFDINENEKAALKAVEDAMGQYHEAKTRRVHAFEAVARAKLELEEAEEALDWNRRYVRQRDGR